MALTEAEADLDSIFGSYLAASASESAESAVRDRTQTAICALLHGFASTVTRDIYASRFESIDAEDAEKIGVEAAKSAASFAAWSEAIGDRLDTAQVCKMLGISRQALAKRQKHGSLVGLAGQRSKWFPIWQFDQKRRNVRPVVARITAAFREALGDADPMLIASWATRRQHEDLEGATPAEWISSGKEPESLVRAARRAASRLAQ